MGTSQPAGRRNQKRSTFCTLKVFLMGKREEKDLYLEENDFFFVTRYFQYFPFFANFLQHFYQFLNRCTKVKGNLFLEDGC